MAEESTADLFGQFEKVMRSLDERDQERVLWFAKGILVSRSTKDTAEKDAS